MAPAADGPAAPVAPAVAVVVVMHLHAQHAPHLQAVRTSCHLDVCKAACHGSMLQAAGAVVKLPEHAAPHTWHIHVEASISLAEHLRQWCNFDAVIGQSRKV